MSIDGMEELTRDEFQAAAEQLERMSIDQFEQLFGSLFNENDFNQDADALVLTVTFDKRYGIDSLHYTHVRASDADDRPIDAGSGEDFERDVLTSETWRLRDDESADDALGITSLTLVHPVTAELTSARLMQGMYDAFIALLTSSQPSVYLADPQLQVELYRHDPQPLDITAIHGEQWTVPDPTPSAEKQVERVPNEQLPTALSQIDAGLPLMDLRCSRQLDACERCDPKPSGLSATDEQQFIDTQLQQQQIHDGDTVRAVAVITRRQHDDAERWTFADLWHCECGLSREVFYEDYSAHQSVGKDEVFIEGIATYGELQETPVGNYYEVTISEIDVLARRGTSRV